MWSIFKAVNQRIIDFKDWKSKVTLANLIAWSGGAVGLITALSGGFDWIAPRVIGYLTGRPDVIAAWVVGHHWVAKSLTSLLIVVFFYLMVFSVQATVLLSEQQPVKTDYRAELTSAIGVNFTRVYDYYDVSNKQGDCYVILEADFQVEDFALSHVERKFGSTSALTWGTPTLEVPTRPPNVDSKFESNLSSDPRVYHFRFVPALSHTTSTTTVKIKEEMTRGVWMYLEDVPNSKVLGGNFEYIAHLVNEPTELLVLEILFPRDYTVPGGLLKVRLGYTENPHVREEQRLLNENALREDILKDRLKLQLTVKQPTMGLCYYLCWVPPYKPQPKTT